MARSLTGGKRRRRSRTRKSRKPRKPRRKSRKSRKPRRKSRKRSKTRRRRRTKQRGGSTLGFGMLSSGNHGQLAPYSIGNRYFGSAAPYTHGK